MNVRILWHVSVLATTLPSLTSSSPVQNVDVAILGARLSGSSAAGDLIKGGVSDAVFEARNRVGGRVLNMELPNGGVQEVGAQYVGSTQDRVIALARSQNLQNFRYWKRHILQAANAIAALNGMARTINVESPWTHPNASEWDSQTFSTWLDQNAYLPATRALFDVTSTSLFSAQPEELSFLYVIAYIAAAGNATDPGTLERLIVVPGGAQESRINGGTQLIAIQLADRIEFHKGSIKLNTPIRRIVKSAKAVTYLTYPYTLFSDDPKTLVINAKHAVHATNLTVQVISVDNSTIIRATFDNSPADASYGALMAFIEADEMRRLDSQTEEQVQAEVLGDFVKYFGSQAANPTGFILQRWDLEEWSCGAPVAFAPPAVLTKYGEALRTPTSDFWVGYMDGAVRSGERVAKEVLVALGKV
ncbi:FAD/NAD(P)-binding domain-containing protein [Rhizodiscina lignyota]|uniref:monoamine oxidase n=1 Tax=Rhizodiscina lignyota TaxID=1504668 RepID=A0A9P4I0X8_9PEZI|nr:FAD/NAD(P)-binding domain-containing protein [Rhizodiscina lignyota]